MLPVSTELKQKLKKLNESLRQTFSPTSLDPQRMRERLGEIGTFHEIKKWDPLEVKAWLMGGSVVGVDGSVNSWNGPVTLAFSVFQALARGTRGEERWAGDIYTSLDEDVYDQQGREDRPRSSTILSGLELKVALDVLKQWSPPVMMMDGSLLHFYVDHPGKVMEISDVAKESGTRVVGISEEIGTHALAKHLFPNSPSWSDRDLFYGVLKVGEAYEWEGWNSYGDGMWKMVFRSSSSPLPIGVDGFSFQKNARLELLKLIYSLTPDQGRGIPFWLDIVDSQVRLTDSLVQTMMEQYIDPDLRHRLFRSKRGDRII